MRRLVAVGALYQDDELVTPLGAALANLPLDPRQALAAAAASGAAAAVPSPPLDASLLLDPATSKLTLSIGS